MTLNNRIFLRWDEAAQMLGMDREGLRQALLYSWSPTRSNDVQTWLPVMLTLPEREYMTTLQYDSWKREPDIFWNNRDSYYRSCEGRDALNFSDGTALALRGACEGASWDSHHGDSCGWGHTFTIGGDRLVVSPETVVSACAVEGHIRGLTIAPLEWCRDGFPFDLCFGVVNCDNSFYVRPPTDLFESALFLRSDVARILEAGNPTESNKQFDERERTSLLRIIRALDVMAKLPPRGAATSVDAQLQKLGFSKPGEATIRKYIDQARALGPDEKPL